MTAAAERACPPHAHHRCFVAPIEARSRAFRHTDGTYLRAISLRGAPMSRTGDSDQSLTTGLRQGAVRRTTL